MTHNALDNFIEKWESNSHSLPLLIAFKKAIAEKTGISLADDINLVLQAIQASALERLYKEELGERAIKNQAMLDRVLDTIAHDIIDLIDTPRQALNKIFEYAHTSQSETLKLAAPHIARIVKNMPKPE